MADQSQRALNTVNNVYAESRDFYMAKRQEYDELWRLAHSIPQAKGKKFNRFIPYTAAAIDLVLPRLAGRLPIFEITTLNEDNEMAAEIMQKLVEWYLDKINFHDFEVRYIKSALTYGTALVQIGWDLQTKTYHPDVAKRMGKDKQINVDEPVLSIIPIEQVYPHPRKVRIHDEWPLIILEKVTKYDLMQDKTLDQAAIKALGEPVGIDRALMFSQINKQPNKNLNMITQPIETPMYDKLTYYGLFDIDGSGDEVESVITVVDGTAVVRMEQNPFWHQCKPFVKLDYNPDPESFFNDGLVKQLKDLQLELNELRNVRSMARALSLKAPLMVDRAANVDLDVLKFSPEAVIPYDQGLSRNPIKKLEIDGKLLELDREETAVKGDMQLRSGINDVVTGTQDVGVTGGDTATGASIAAEQVNLRYRVQAILIDNAMKEIGQQLCWNLQQFIDQPKAFRILGKEDGQEWLKIKPEMIRGGEDNLIEYDFQVTPMSTLVEPKSAKRERVLVLKNLYGQDPRVDQDALDRQVFQLFDMDPDKLLKSQEVQGQDSHAAELENLSRQILDPSFAQLPPAQQQQMLHSLEQLKAMGQGQPAPQAPQSPIPMPPPQMPAQPSGRQAVAQNAGRASVGGALG